VVTTFLVRKMRLGTFHKKKKHLINKIKINFLSLFLKNRRGPNIDSKNIKSCLLIHDNSKIGDLIVLSALYRILSRKGIALTILSCGSGHAFLNAHPHIDQLLIKKSNNMSELLKLRHQLRKRHFDVVLDPFETFPCFGHALLLSGLRDSYVLGFDKWYKRYYSRYNPHDEQLNEHMSSRTNVIVRQLFERDADDDYRYDIAIPADVEDAVSALVGSSDVVAINPLGAKKICRLSSEQMLLIHSWFAQHHPGLRIIYTGHPDDLSSIPVSNIETLPYPDFIYTVALTKLSKYVVSVDTALVHIASAFNRPMLALYPQARTAEYPSPLIWAPNSECAEQIISPTHFVSDIDERTLINGLERLMACKMNATQ